MFWECMRASRPLRQSASSPPSLSADPPLRHTAWSERNHWSALWSDPPVASEDSASALWPNTHTHTLTLFAWWRCWCDGVVVCQTHLSDVSSVSCQSVGLVVQLLLHVLNLPLTSVIILHHLTVKTTAHDTGTDCTLSSAANSVTLSRRHWDNDLRFAWKTCSSWLNVVVCQWSLVRTRNWDGQNNANEFDYNGNVIIAHDFHDAEKANGTAESSHKNGIYSIIRNVTEFFKFCTNKSNAVSTSVCE